MLHLLYSVGIASINPLDVVWGDFCASTVLFVPPLGNLALRISLDSAANRYRYSKSLGNGVDSNRDISSQCTLYRRELSQILNQSQLENRSSLKGESCFARA